MRTFALPDLFDAVVCLYCSIEYMRDLDELFAAVDRMAAHLTPGGVLLVEPSGEPDPADVGGIDHLVIEQDGRTIIQLIHSRPVSDRLSITDMYSLVGDDSGVRSWVETHEMGLFALDEYRDAFTRAGLDAVEVVRWPRHPYRVVGVKPH
jgi:SAM-dependent methyltransferase